MTERRNEERHVVPGMYREYFTFKARGAKEFVPMKLLNFSGHGIRVKSQQGVSVNPNIECLIATPKSFSKEILFVGGIKYCIQDESEGDYLIGVEALETDDPIGFELFSKGHHFIKERIGGIF